jgi:hypothetical protein
MFSRGKDKKKAPVANQLSGAAEPNSLSWAAADADELETAEEKFEGEFDEDAEDEEADDGLSDEEREAELQAELARQAEEFGLTKLDATDLYGPNGEDVEAVIEALKTIGINRAIKLSDAWEAADSPQRDLVQGIVQRQSRREKYRADIYQADSAIEAWLLSPERSDYASDWAGEELTLRVVGMAARDAVHALILDEQLDDADFDTLYGPWYEVMDAEPGADDAASTADEADEAEGEAEDEDEGDAEAGAEDGRYGPNSALVEDLLGRLRGLSQESLNSIEKAWAAADRGALKDAHKDLDKAVKEDRDWRDQVRLAQDQIVEWASLRPSRQPVVPPLADCVAALVMADVLDPENAETLYKPWADVVGAPALPTFEDEEAK